MPSLEALITAALTLSSELRFVLERNTPFQLINYLFLAISKFFSINAKIHI
jgi:hypothetical protein